MNTAPPMTMGTVTDTGLRKATGCARTGPTAIAAPLPPLPPHPPLPAADAVTTVNTGRAVRDITVAMDAGRVADKHMPYQMEKQCGRKQM